MNNVAIIIPFSNSIGDSLVALPCIFNTAIHYNKDTIHIITINSNNLYRYINLPKNCKIHDITKYNNYTHIIDSIGITTIILLSSKTKIIKEIKKSNAKKVVCFSHMHTIFSPRFKNLLVNRRKLKDMNRYLLLLKKLDNNIQTTKVGIKFNITECSFVDNIIQKYINKFRKIIAINALCHSAKNYNLTIEDWEDIAIKLSSRFQDYLFIWTEYEQYKSTKKKLEDNRANNLIIFNNDNNLYNLVYLLNKANAIISPSTGNIHIADLLGIDVISIMPYYDLIRYPCGNYGGNFISHYLPKNWKTNYGTHKEKFLELIFDSVSKL